jgi:Sec-independent protein translocase protein TatA
MTIGLGQLLLVLLLFVLLFGNVRKITEDVVNSVKVIRKSLTDNVDSGNNNKLQ